MSYDEHLISQAGGDGEETERIARIAASNKIWLQSSVTNRTDHDIKFLLALVRDQAAKLEAVRDQAAKLDLLTMACEEAEECGRDWISVKGIRASLESKP